MSVAPALLKSHGAAAPEPFDAIASSYDSVFTDSTIGRAQRAQVLLEIDRWFHPGMRILDLNCGTGEDALAMGRRGVEVSAYDASSSMIDVALYKLRANAPEGRVTFGVLRNEHLNELDGVFDGVLSNFAGINCSHAWPAIARELARLVRPGGHILLCIMGRACLWEFLYFLLTGQCRRAFRRRSRSRIASIGADHIQVHYVSVNEAARAFSSSFTLRGWRGVGVFVPPTYCEPIMKRRHRLLNLLSTLDSRIGSLPGIRCWGDHLLLDFVRIER